MPFDLGKRVLHSAMTEKKLSEVRKALDNDAMVVILNFLLESSNIPQIRCIDEFKLVRMLKAMCHMASQITWVII